MLIARLTIRYDRGIEYNRPKDIIGGGLKRAEKLVHERGYETKDGKVIRGIGTHYRNKAIMEVVRQRDKEGTRIRDAFRKHFLITMLDGTYIVPQPGAAKHLLGTLKVRDDVQVHVHEFSLETGQTLDLYAVNEWAERIKNQFKLISLGHNAKADEDGLRALDTLSHCPILAEDTGARIREMVQMVRDNKLTRIEVRRQLDKLAVGINQKPLVNLAPRRAPVIKSDDAPAPQQPQTQPQAAVPAAAPAATDGEGWRTV